jgi:Patatin-like phospholipase
MASDAAIPRSFHSCILTDRLAQVFSPRIPRILSLDGGGVRGLSSLLILREIMRDIGQQVDATEVKPCEYFDLIGGTSTGGLIAVMLGTLGMVLPLPFEQC